MTVMRDQSLRQLQRDYLDTSTAGMPIGGLIAWGALALISWQMGDAMPAWVAFTAAAAPVPLSIVVDKLRGAPGLTTQSSKNPLTQLFMRFIFVIALIIPFVIFSAQPRAGGSGRRQRLESGVSVGMKARLTFFRCNC